MVHFNSCDVRREMCHSQTKVGVSVLLIFIQIEKWTRFLVCTLFRVKLHCSQMTHDAPYKCDTTHMTQMNNQKSEKQQSRTGNRVYLRTAQAQRERYQNACVLCALIFFFHFNFVRSFIAACYLLELSLFLHEALVAIVFILNQMCNNFSYFFVISFLWAQLADGRSSDSISCYARARHVQYGCSSFICIAAPTIIWCTQSEEEGDVVDEK